MLNYFNAFRVFECGRKLLDILEVLIERACTATPKEEYITEMLDSLLKDKERHGTPLSRKNLQEAVSRVMEDNVNNVTMDTLIQSPVAINAQKKYANVTNERQIASEIHVETIK